MDKGLYMEYNLQFFAKDGPGGEKTEEPTAKKLDDARKEGQVAKSKEISSSVMLFAMFLILKIWTGNMAEQLLGIFAMSYNRFSEFTTYYGGRFSVSTFDSFFKTCLLRVLIILAPFLIMGVVVSFVANVVQVKWKPTTKPLKPKFSKLSPISGIKRLFSMQSLIELLKSIVKIAAICIILYNELKNKWTLLFLLYDMPLLQAIIMAGDLLISVGLKISAVFLVIAAADFVFQKWKFKQDMMMTKQEVKDEYKNSEGDPQVKGQIRARMRQASQRRMMENLPKADVVITNPTHYAVAIVYDKEQGEAPIVLAKGADYLAQRIKDVARENSIEIVENKPLARSLYANVEVGEQVPPELYVAVAEVLAYVYKLKGRI